LATGVVKAVTNDGGLAYEVYFEVDGETVTIVPGEHRYRRLRSPSPPATAAASPMLAQRKRRVCFAVPAADESADDEPEADDERAGGMQEEALAAAAPREIAAGVSVECDYCGEDCSAEHYHSDIVRQHKRQLMLDCDCWPFFF
jgi:hypothetical protein